MNYPTSDVQHIAQMLVRTRNGDQTTRAEEDRLDQIATKGYSSFSDAPPPVSREEEAARLAAEPR